MHKRVLAFLVMVTTVHAQQQQQQQQQRCYIQCDAEDSSYQPTLSTRPTRRQGPPGKRGPPGQGLPGQKGEPGELCSDAEKLTALTLKFEEVENQLKLVRRLISARSCRKNFQSLTLQQMLSCSIL